ncbi:MAG: polyprenyl diphosphate synthase [Acidobacteriota bacterium]
MNFSRVPRHVGIIPDGNRRWADARGLPRGAGYAAGVMPGLQLLKCCQNVGIEELSVYGFTKENVHRPKDQVRAFQEACTELATRAAEAGAAVFVVGDTDSAIFPEPLRPFARERSKGDIRLNLLVNYGWQWDLYSAISRARNGHSWSYSDTPRALASSEVSRVDLVVRWGGRRRLSGFLPMQCAYADFYVIDTLWPEMSAEEFLRALQWYQDQDITLGG